MGEEDEAVRLGGAEVEGDGAHPLGVPLGQADEGLGGLEGDGVQGGHVLAAVRHLALDLHLGVHDAGQPGQLQADVVVLVHHLHADEGVNQLKPVPCVHWAPTMLNTDLKTEV